MINARAACDHHTLARRGPLRSQVEKMINMVREYEFRCYFAIIGLALCGLLFIVSSLAQKDDTAVWAFLVAIPLALWLRSLKRRLKEEKRLRALQISQIDSMDGISFERYVARLLQFQNYRTEFTPASGDLGIDIVANKNGQRYAVQCKRQSSSVSRRAVSDAVAGRPHYKCSHAMVITNSWFTRGAKTLAQSTGCRLVDREILTEWILDYQGKTASPSKNFPIGTAVTAETTGVEAPTKTQSVFADGIWIGFRKSPMLSISLIVGLFLVLLVCSVGSEKPRRANTKPVKIPTPSIPASRSLPTYSLAKPLPQEWPTLSSDSMPAAAQQAPEESPKANPEQIGDTTTNSTKHASEEAVYRFKKSIVLVRNVRDMDEIVNANREGKSISLLKRMIDSGTAYVAKKHDQAEIVGQINQDILPEGIVRVYVKGQSGYWVTPLENLRDEKPVPSTHPASD